MAMTDTVTRWLSHVKDDRNREFLRAVLIALADRYTSQSLNSAGLRIKGGSASALAQAHTAFDALASGVLVTKAADTDMAALAGTVTNAQFGVYVFFIDAAGTLTTAFGGSYTTLALLKFPPFPAGKAALGYVRVNPTGTGDFVGGTTALDDATVVPNAVFVNFTTGAVDPAVLP